MVIQEKLEAELERLEQIFQEEYIDGYEPLTKEEALKLVDELCDIFHNSERIDSIDKLTDYNEFLGVRGDIVVNPETGKINIDKYKLLIPRLIQLRCAKFRKTVSGLHYVERIIKENLMVPAFIYNGHLYVISEDILNPNSNERECIPYKFGVDHKLNSLSLIEKVDEFIRFNSANKSGKYEITLAFWGVLDDGLADSKYDIEKLADIGYFDTDITQYRVKLINFRPTKIGDDYVIFTSSANDVGNIYDVNFMQEMANKYDIMYISGMPCIRSIDVCKIKEGGITPFQEVVDSIRQYYVIRDR